MVSRKRGATGWGVNLWADELIRADRWEWGLRLMEPSPHSLHVRWMEADCFPLGDGAPV